MSLKLKHEDEQPIELWTLICIPKLSCKVVKKKVGLKSDEWFAFPHGAQFRDCEINTIVKFVKTIVRSWIGIHIPLSMKITTKWLKNDKEKSVWFSKAFTLKCNAAAQQPRRHREQLKAAAVSPLWIPLSFKGIRSVQMRLKGALLFLNAHLDSHPPCELIANGMRGVMSAWFDLVSQLLSTSVCFSPCIIENKTAHFFVCFDMFVCAFADLQWNGICSFWHV